MSMLWGGRFAKGMDKLLEQFNASIGFDQRMYAADIQGSIAYAHALEKVGHLTADEARAIVDGLNAVLAEFDAGTFALLPSDEDIHTAVERRLGELIGDVAGKLHTGRSRNDQVATDMRLYLLARIPVLREHLLGVAARHRGQGRGAPRRRSCPATRTCNPRSRSCSRTG